MAELDISSFCSEVTSCGKQQKELARELRAFAENLKSSNVGLVGGSLAIAGLVLAPVSAGASLGLTIVGGLVGGGVGVSGISSMITDHRITKKAEEHVSQRLHDYAKRSEDIQSKLTLLLTTLQDSDRNVLQDLIEKSIDINVDTKNELIEMIRSAEKISFPVSLVGKGNFVIISAKGVVDSVIKAVKITRATKRAVSVVERIAAGAKATASMFSFSRSLGTAADVSTDVTSATGKAATAGKAAAAGVKVGGVVLAVAGVALDLGAVIYYSRKLHKNEPSKTVENILKMADCLDTE